MVTSHLPTTAPDIPTDTRDVARPAERRGAPVGRSRCRHDRDLKAPPADQSGPDPAFPGYVDHAPVHGARRRTGLDAGHLAFRPRPVGF